MSKIDAKTLLLDVQRRERRALIRGMLLLLIPLLVVLGILGYLNIQSRKLKALGRLYQGAATELTGEFGPRSAVPSIKDFDRESALAAVQGRRREALQLALQLYDQRVSFKWGGKTPSDGMDTSGFVAYVLNRVGIIDHPETYWSGLLRKTFQARDVTNVSEIMPGDLIFEEDKACWFKLTDKDAIGMIPSGIEIANPATFGSTIVGYGKVPYEISSKKR